MSSVRQDDWNHLAAKYPGATIADAPDGTAMVSLPRVPLPAGWSLASVCVWFLVPVGYPAAQPDCFWTSSELRLASGAMPSNSGIQDVGATGGRALWFSWHPTTWRPAHDGLATFAHFIVRRFDDAR
jgi:hypothetical protein